MYFLQLCFIYLFICLSVYLIICIIEHLLYDLGLVFKKKPANLFPTIAIF